MKLLILSCLFIFATINLSADALNLYKNCAGCHGENGEESALQKSKLIGGQESNLTVKELTAYKNGELNQYGLGNIMKLQLTSISEDEIQELADYIEQLDINGSNQKSDEIIEN